MTPSDYRLGLVLVTASAVAWSLAGLFIRLIHLDTWTMLAWRGLFGALGIALVVLAMRGRDPWRSLLAMAWPTWSFAVVSALGMILFIASLRHTTVAHVAVIYATVPFFAAALGWLALRERPSTSAVLASLAALTGVALMVGLGVEGGLFGDLLALGMTVCMAVIMVILRRFRHISAMPAAGVSALMSGVVCWPFGHPLAVTGSDLFLLALFGLVNSAAGLALFTIGARRLPPMETALIGSLDAPLAPLWVWLAFSEAPSGSTVIGGAVVFMAVGFHIALNALGPQIPPAIAPQ
ncbi:MAG TPA: DMT family transporter [Lichenihabitans sp.]|jgi:drug/metabolite transporter (DMT)-like permease|nr:DMT family transporter [Lichenihabitans sp.]